jgi:hypothetical protein
MICPVCHSESIIPIVYGYVGGGILEEARLGLVKLAGCMTPIPGNEHYCNNCEFAWYDINSPGIRDELHSYWKMGDFNRPKKKEEYEDKELEKTLKRRGRQSDWQYKYRDERGARFPVLVKRANGDFCAYRNFQSLVNSEDERNLEYIVDSSGFFFRTEEPFALILFDDEDIIEPYDFFKEVEAAPNLSSHHRFLDFAVRGPDHIVHHISRVFGKGTEDRFLF